MSRDPNEAVYGPAIGRGFYLRGPRWGGKEYFNPTTPRNRAMFGVQAMTVAACHAHKHGHGSEKEEEYLARAREKIALFRIEDAKEAEWEAEWEPWEVLWASLYQQAGGRPYGIGQYWYDCGRIQRPHDRGQLDTPWPGEEVA